MSSHRTLPVVGAVVLLTLLLVACAGSNRRDAADAADATGAPVAAGAASTGELPGLHNVHEFAPGVYSGSMPEGDAGFDSLKRLGIRSVVSVDGARPDLDRAGARSLRYVHVPTQYSGIEPDARAALAKAIRDLPRPIYVHCHHGKHRGPAAAAFALVATGEIDASRGLELLDLAGTSPSYPGLFQCVDAATEMDDQFITRFGGDLPAEAKVSGLVASMAAIDRAWDHLQRLRDHGWSAPPDHPDLVAAAEAGRLHDHLRALAGDPEVRDRPDDFHRMLKDSIARADALERALLADDDAAANRAIVAVAATCRDCHAAYRNEAAR